MKTKRLWIFVGVLLHLTGCSSLQTWTQLQKEEYQDHSYQFTAQVPAGWMRFNQGKGFGITKDGFLLNQIGVDRIKANSDLKTTKKKFLEGMTNQELAEVQIDALKSTPGVSDVQIAENRPATVSGQPAFFFSYSFRNADGLLYKGQVAGFWHQRTVYRLFYEAPAAVYYERDLGAWQQFLQSFKRIEKDKT